LLREPHPFELLLVPMRPVVVVDTGAPPLERAAAQDVECVAFEDRRARAEALEVALELLARAVAHREVVDADEVALVAELRRDQARTAVGADLDVALTGFQQ